MQGELFHVFLSYRVRSDAHVVAKLYELVVSGSLQDKRIPPGGHGRWPGFAKEPPRGSGKAAKVFLDKKCLQDGREASVCTRERGKERARGRGRASDPLIDE